MLTTLWLLVSGAAQSPIVKYIAIGIGIIIAAAFIKHQITAPYKAVIVEQIKASEQKDAIIIEDAKRQQADAEQAEREKGELNEHIAQIKAEAAGKPDICQPTSEQLTRLRQR